MQSAESTAAIRGELREIRKQHAELRTEVLYLRSFAGAVILVAFVFGPFTHRGGWIVPTVGLTLAIRLAFYAVERWKARHPRADLSREGAS